MFTRHSGPPLGTIGARQLSILPTLLPALLIESLLTEQFGKLKETSLSVSRSSKLPQFVFRTTLNKFRRLGPPRVLRFCLVYSAASLIDVPTQLQSLSQGGYLLKSTTTLVFSRPLTRTVPLGDRNTPELPRRPWKRMLVLATRSPRSNEKIRKLFELAKTFSL